MVLFHELLDELGLHALEVFLADADVLLQLLLDSLHRGSLISVLLIELDKAAESLKAA